MNCRKDLIRIAQCNWMAFLNRYREYYTDEFIERFSTAEKGIDKLHILDDEARRQGYPLYLIIDEYDNFTNVVLNEKGNEIYHAITHASGFYRDAFKNYKGMFDRIFMIGVSPVTWTTCRADIT